MDCCCDISEPPGAHLSEAFDLFTEGDALYDSPIEPWSRVLTGQPDGDPGIDPLGYLVKRAHAEGIEVHAWFNPYRLKSSPRTRTSERHASHWAAAQARQFGQLTWLDPGEPIARDLAVAVISDVIDRYDVDGVHIDAYFYPYPQRGQTFPDDSSYSRYQDAGGDLDRDAWRRANVDGLVEEISRVVRTNRPNCRFGISPFGIYRPGQPEGIRGMDQVTAIHADPMLWYRSEWVDYLAPQLYWPTTRRAQAYDRLLTWWDEHSTEDRPLLVGLDLTKVGNDPAWTHDEGRTQVGLSREAARTGGQIWFRARPVMTNQAGIADLLDELYATPALPPPLARQQAPVSPPNLSLEDGGVEVALEKRRAIVVYRDDPDQVTVHTILPGRTQFVPLEPGTWLVSSVANHGGESQAIRVRIP